jgi:hypothetical protein
MDFLYIYILFIYIFAEPGARNIYGAPCFTFELEISGGGGGFKVGTNEKEINVYYNFKLIYFQS